MTEHKYTDEEVIKALDGKAEAHCAVCDIKGIVPCEHCIFHYVKHSLDLINRQKAEIERLTAEKDTLIKTYKECMVEAIKEFAEKLKEKAYVNKPYGVGKSVDECDVDALVKEMTEI